MRNKKFRQFNNCVCRIMDALGSWLSKKEAQERIATLWLASWTLSKLPNASITHTYHVPIIQLCKNRDEAEMNTLQFPLHKKRKLQICPLNLDFVLSFLHSSKAAYCFGALTLFCQIFVSPNRHWKRTDKHSNGFIGSLACIRKGGLTRNGISNFIFSP